MALVLLFPIYIHGRRSGRANWSGKERRLCLRAGPGLGVSQDVRYKRGISLELVG